MRRAHRTPVAALAVAVLLAGAGPSLAQPTQPRWKPWPELFTNKNALAYYLADEWTIDIGRLVIHREREEEPDVYAGEIYANGSATPTHVLETLLPSEDSTGLTGVWRKVGSTDAQPVRIVLSQYDGDVFAATFVGYIEGHGEISGRRGYTQPQPQPDPVPTPEPGDPEPQPEQPAPSTGAFKPLAKYQVRVDRVTAASDGPRTDVFMTLKNATSAPLYVTSGALQVRLVDSDGLTKENGQVLRPTPAGREHFPSTPVLDPAGELKVKFSFHRDSAAAGARVIVIEGAKRAEF